MLTELLDTDSGLLVSRHIRSMDQNEAIKTVKRKITDIDSMKIDAQKKAVREGFDMDIIPTRCGKDPVPCRREGGNLWFPGRVSGAHLRKVPALDVYKRQSAGSSNAF